MAWKNSLVTLFYDNKMNHGKLEDALGHRFSNKKLLKLALTHSSARDNKDGRRNNERLEFLGDRVLGLVVADILLECFPSAHEGELAKRFNRLVCARSCAHVAREMDIGPHLFLGHSEDLSNGREKPAILSDACEAVLGAIFLDGGYMAGERTVRKFWKPLLLRTDEIPHDPKSALQEWLQARSADLPTYEEIARKGPDHAPLFVIEVKAEGLEPARGKGGSKRAAEQDAAQNMLVREKVWSNE
jgi:ribonuclease-3